MVVNGMQSTYAAVLLTLIVLGQPQRGPGYDSLELSLVQLWPARAESCKTMPQPSPCMPPTRGPSNLQILQNSGPVPGDRRAQDQPG